MKGDGVKEGDVVAVLHAMKMTLILSQRKMERSRRYLPRNRITWI